MRLSNNFITKYRINIFVYACLIGTTSYFYSCSDDDALSGCYKDRKVVDTVVNVEGTIRGKGVFCNDFTIEPDEKSSSRPLGVLFPCNLEENYKTDDIKVVFSGKIYESFDTEDICADFFEITSIRTIN
ncbi:hypothetical protein B7P33_05450 [Sediminicola luteus]|uniref:Uncharacterized protein n=1 Tax=Sediminicola luteus TaxID=319238 RepID=A0A2A4GFD0_9FLAO|nr:hypothetical protein B7P33_05450 [Sediminicola luteus]